jgi:hypothetical protein
MLAAVGAFVLLAVQAVLALGHPPQKSDSPIAATWSKSQSLIRPTQTSVVTQSRRNPCHFEGPDRGAVDCAVEARHEPLASRFRELRPSSEPEPSARIRPRARGPPGDVVV